MNRHLLVACWTVAITSGCSEPTSNEPPVPELGQDRMVFPNVEIQFSGDRSYDPDGEIVSYDWNFGDDASASGAIVSHTWTTEATYAVTLTVEDDRGAKAADAIRVVVTTSFNNDQPVAILEGPASGLPGQLLTFRGDMSHDPDGTIVDHRWDFGDGQTATGSVAEHTFAAEGQMIVTLTVEDDVGALGQATRSVAISSTANQPPIAHAGLDIETDISTEVTFDGRGSTDPDGSVVAYEWDFGDGSTAGAPQATHSYAAMGTYTVELTVEDDEGARASDELTVTVRPPTDFDGTWILNPATPSVTCMNTRRTYIVPFPASEIVLSQSLTQMVTAQVTGTSRVMNGSIDRSLTPPEISLTDTTNETDATCGSATVEHRLSGKLSTPQTFTEGRYSVIYTWTDAFCSCARTFDVTGAKR